MKTQIGVWIDKKKAIIIKLAGKASSVNYVYSELDDKQKIDGEGKLFGRFGTQFLSLENKKENRNKKQITAYLKKIILLIKNTDEIVLLGPSGMKNELKKMMLEDYYLKTKIVAVITSDSMTENQLVARVKEFFEGIIKVK